MDHNARVGIADRRVQAHGEVFDVISPHTEESIAEVTAATPADVDLAVGAARKADSGTDVSAALQSTLWRRRPSARHSRRIPVRR
jgi:acyl-CoA reductase-like NAD-dependent aldehyde dehydrogenase